MKTSCDCHLTPSTHFLTPGHSGVRILLKTGTRKHHLSVGIPPLSSQHVSAVQLVWQVQQWDVHLPVDPRQGDPGQAPQLGSRQGQYAPQPWVQREPGKTEGEQEEEEECKHADGRGGQGGGPDDQGKTCFQTRFGSTKIQEEVQSLLRKLQQPLQEESQEVNPSQNCQEDCSQKDWLEHPEERISDQGLHAEDSQHSYENSPNSCKTALGQRKEVGVVENAQRKET